MTVNTAKTSNVNIRKIAMTGVLAAIATVLMFLHFQLPFMPSSQAASAGGEVQR